MLEIPQQVPQALLLGAGQHIVGGMEVMMVSTMEAVTEPSAVEEQSVQGQIVDLASVIVFLEQLWLEEPEIQEQIDPAAWQRFMEAVYGQLLELKRESIRVK